VILCLLVLTQYWCVTDGRTVILLQQSLASIAMLCCFATEMKPVTDKYQSQSSTLLSYS